jgi:hypothetical protein
MTTSKTLDEPGIIAWFSRQSFSNQFAAAANPRRWAELQAAGKPDIDVDDLEACAAEWQAYLERSVGAPYDGPVAA